MANVVKLESVIDQTEAQNLYTSIVQHIDGHDELEIDASKVERMGTSGVQVLLSVAIYLKKKGKNFKLKAFSGAFEAAFNDLGFVGLIQEWKAK
jgi:anti-anti-sigma regulatory factor